MLELEIKSEQVFVTAALLRLGLQKGAETEPQRRQMATAEQLKALLKSHAEGDEDRFYSIAMQLAAQAAKQGHGRLAQELRELVDRAKARPDSGRGPVPLVQPRGELSGLLSVGFPKVRLADMVLDARVRSRLERVLLEYRQQTKLRSRGLTPRRKLLLLGPP